MNGANVHLMRNDLLRVSFVHLRLEDVDDFVLSDARQEVLAAPVDLVHVVILLEFHATSIFLGDRVNGDGAVDGSCSELIVARVEGD